MTPNELAGLALNVHIGALTLSLPAVYAALSDKFVLPTIEKLEDLCANTRGKLTSELAEQLRKFVESGQSQNASSIGILASNGEPIRPPTGNVPSLNSEEFKDALRSFLDDESTVFDKYWLALETKHRLHSLWSKMKVVTCVWPACSLAGIVFSCLEKYGYIEASTLMHVVSLCLLAPMGLFVISLPRCAFLSNRLDRMRM